MSPQAMRAGVYLAPGRVALAERPLPVPRRGEVRVRITACGLCGSDLHVVRSPRPIVQPGTILGHEMTGAVDALGPGVDEPAEGTSVVIEPLSSCGTCGPCREGRDSVCRELEIYGLQRAGGFADAVVVPAQRLYVVPNELKPPLAALAEPFAVAVHGLRIAGFGPGNPPRNALVLGAGAIGLAVSAVARAWGFEELSITARYPHQARLAKQLGVAQVIDAGTDDLDGFDAGLVIETVGGTADTMTAATRALAPGGSISVLGVFTEPMTLDPHVLLRREARLLWSNCYARRPGEEDFVEAVRILTEDRAAERYGGLLTHEAPLDDIEEAFEIAGDKRSNAVKVTITP